jgi:hypothetical protein
VADHHVIDDALETADHVLDDGGPCDTPYGPRDRTFDDRTIERYTRRCRFGRSGIGGNLGGGGDGGGAGRGFDERSYYRAEPNVSRWTSVQFDLGFRCSSLFGGITSPGTGPAEWTSARA